MKNPKSQKKAFSVELSDTRLKVFRIGRTPVISGGTGEARAPSKMRGIHSHFTYEIFFVTEGKLELITEDGADIYERRVVIVPPRLRHYSVPDGEGSYCLLFAFEGRRDGAEERRSEIEKRLDGGICELPLSEEVAFYIHKVSEKSAENDAVSERASEFLIALIFNEIVAHLSEERSGASVERRASAYISEIETYVNSNIGKRLTLGDVAERVHLSTRQVSRVLKSEYGCGFTELVTEKRLAVAEMLLKNTSLRIGEIAEQVNLGSENYFYTLFKKRYGMSPLKYRRAAKTNEKSIDE